MTKKIITLILLLHFIIGQTFSQTCENYNRKLFNLLPKNYPENINCKDLSGKKQGDWILYEISYNSSNKSLVLDTGYYVEEYSYGQFLDDRKVGTWKSIQNVHLIYSNQEDTYFYAKDTFSITTKRSTDLSKLTLIRDSTIIKFSYSPLSKEMFPICIDCYKEQNNCIMSYRNNTIKKFPYNNFNLEYERVQFLYKREMKSIDEKLK
jgi:hypothetical protein